MWGGVGVGGVEWGRGGVCVCVLGRGCASGDRTDGHLQTVTGDQMITLRILVHK